jgi:hypothetical protein
MNKIKEKLLLCSKKIKAFLFNLYGEASTPKAEESIVIIDTNNQTFNNNLPIKIEESKIYNAIKDSAINDKIEKNRLQAMDILIAIEKIKNDLVIDESQAFYSIVQLILSKYNNKQSIMDFIMDTLKKTHSNKKEKPDVIKINGTNKENEKENRSTKKRKTAQYFI